MTAEQSKKATDAATEAATTSCERVARAAKKVSDTLTHREKRAKTHPFVKVEDFEGEDDSLVTSIENVTNTIKKE